MALLANSHSKPSLIVRLSGGLGNQMFQYAAALPVAKRNRLPLFIDTTCLHGQDSYCYSLGVFRISSQVVSTGKLQSFTFRLACSPTLVLKPATTIVRALFGNLLMLREAQLFSVDSRLWSLPPRRTTCMHGYWQCHEYFTGAEHHIRQEFEFRDPPTAPNGSMLSRILASNAVSIHVRRGDYLTLKDAPVLGLNYYQRAVELIRSRVINPHYFVFSDDIPWTKANLCLPQESTFLDINSAQAPVAMDSHLPGQRRINDHEDLRLMSACRHHIIANSSFSWWGAWLNVRTDKIVVAPKYWGCRPATYYPALFPPQWALVDNLP